MADRAALLTFSHVMRLRHRLTEDISRIQQALADVAPSGHTSLIDGASAAITLSASDIGRSLFIVFSDGVDTSSWLSPDVVLQSARRSNVVVYGEARDGQCAGRLPRRPVTPRDREHNADGKREFANAVV